MESINFSLENHLFSIPLLVGFIFTLIGSLVYQFPPQDINPLVGYRTKNSMKSKERWDFAQKYAFKLLTNIGIVLMCLSVFGLVFKVKETVGQYVAATEVIMATIILIYKTERAIKQKFD